MPVVLFFSSASILLMALGTTSNHITVQALLNIFFCVVKFCNLSKKMFIIQKTLFAQIFLSKKSIDAKVFVNGQFLYSFMLILKIIFTPSPNQKLNQSYLEM